MVFFVCSPSQADKQLGAGNPSEHQPETVGSRPASEEGKPKLTESAREFRKASTSERRGRGAAVGVRARIACYSNCSCFSYVPISQLAKYFFCSAVSLSICTPIPASLSLAISLSIVGGTG